MANGIVSGVAVIDGAAEAGRVKAGEYNSRALTGKAGVKGGGDAAKTAQSVSFRECLNNAVENETSIFPAGRDVVMSNPPVYCTNYKVDMDKSREEMTLDEYKRYICNRVSALPVSDSMRACSSGVLIWKEEAFENMKSDPAYEEEVIGMLKEDFSAQLSSYEPNAAYRVIGGTREECYGAAIPVKSYSWMAGLQNGLTSSALSANYLSGLNLSQSLRLANSLSGLGLASSGLFTNGLSGLGLVSSGLWANGLSSLGLAGLGASSRNTDSLQGLSGIKGSRADMINAYRKSMQSRKSDRKRS